MVFAGKTHCEVGTKVRVKGITDQHDKDLNGRTGVLCQPFYKFPIRDVGVRLDGGEGEVSEESITIFLNEFETVGF